MRFDGIPRSLQDFIDDISRRLQRLELAKAPSGGGASEPGPPGADGRTVLNGTGAPGAGLGADGDFYIDTAADAIYGPKTAGAWGSPTSLIGPSGADGTDGVDGTNGTDGVDGVDGAPGAILLEAGDTIPADIPPGTPTGTLVYRKVV